MRYRSWTAGLKSAWNGSQDPVHFRNVAFLKETNTQQWKEKLIGQDLWKVVSAWVVWRKGSKNKSDQWFHPKMKAVLVFTL